MKLCWVFLGVEMGNWCVVCFISVCVGPSWTLALGCGEENVLVAALIPRKSKGTLPCTWFRKVAVVVRIMSKEL